MKERNAFIQIRRTISMRSFLAMAFVLYILDARYLLIDIERHGHENRIVKNGFKRKLIYYNVTQSVKSLVM